MGFSDYQDRVPNPAQIFYRWKGGEKKITLDNGETVKKVKGELQYWDGEENQVAELPLQIWAIEQTRNISGYSPKMNSNVRYYSNEAVKYNDVLNVMRHDENGSTQVASGAYSQIKGTLPEGANLCIRLYFYNPDNEQIEALNLQGAARNAFIDFSKKNRIYDGPIALSVGDLKTTGSNDYFVPKFETVGKYSDEQKVVLRAKEDELKVYLKALSDRNQTIDPDEMSQEPAYYDGDQSQVSGKVEEIIPGVEDVDGEISIDEIPFE